MSVWAGEVIEHVADTTNGSHRSAASFAQAARLILSTPDHGPLS